MLETTESDTPPRSAAAVLTVRFFAAAKAAVGSAEISLTVPGSLSIEGALDIVARESADPARAQQVFARCSFLVNAVAVTDESTVLEDGDTLDVLPPFAGG